MTRPVYTLLDGEGIIGTDELVDACVTAAKLADDAVTTAKIGIGVVGASEIADDVITDTELAAGYKIRENWLPITLGSNFTGAGWAKNIGNELHFWLDMSTSTSNLSIGVLPVGARPNASYSVPVTILSNATIGNGLASINADGTIVRTYGPAIQGPYRYVISAVLPSAA